MAQARKTAQPRATGASFASALAAPVFRRLLAAFAASALASRSAPWPSPLVVYQRRARRPGRRPTASARLLPYLLCSGLSGALADRFDRRRVLVCSVTVRLVLAVALAAAVAVALAPAVLVVLTFALAAAGTPSYPVMAAVTPSVVAPETLPAANGLLSAVEAVSFFLGPAVGGAMLTLGPMAGLVLDVAVFAVALTVLRSVPDLPAPAAACPEKLRRQVAAGVRAITGSGDALAPMLLVATSNFVYGGSLVALLLLATDAGHGRPRVRGAHGRVRHRQPGRCAGHRPPGPGAAARRRARGGHARLRGADRPARGRA